MRPNQLDHTSRLVIRLNNSSKESLENAFSSLVGLNPVYFNNQEMCDQIVEGYLEKTITLKEINEFLS